MPDLVVRIAVVVRSDVYLKTRQGAELGEHSRRELLASGSSTNCTNPGKTVVSKTMKKHHFSLFRLLGSAFSFQIVLSINVLAEIKHDYGTYPVPTAPPLPAAGGTIIDPTFETTIMRLTDANDGPDCVNAYSYWPTFNIDITRLLVHSGIAPLLYRFDPVNFAIIDKAIWDTPTPIGGTVGWEDAIWSGSDPDLIYAHDTIGMHLWAYNAATQTYTQLADFTSQYNPGITCGR